MNVNNVVNLPENYFSPHILSLLIPVHLHVCSLQVTHQCCCAVLATPFFSISHSSSFSKMLLYKPSLVLPNKRPHKISTIKNYFKKKYQQQLLLEELFYNFFIYTAKALIANNSFSEQTCVRLWTLSLIWALPLPKGVAQGEGRVAPLLSAQSSYKKSNNYKFNFLINIIIINVQLLTTQACQKLTQLNHKPSRVERLRRSILQLILPVQKRSIRYHSDELSL